MAFGVQDLIAELKEDVFFFKVFLVWLGFVSQGKVKKGRETLSERYVLYTVYLCTLLLESLFFFLGHLLHDYGALIFDFVLHDYGAVSRGIDWDFEHLFFRTI